MYNFSSREVLLILILPQKLRLSNFSLTLLILRRVVTTSKVKPFLYNKLADGQIVLFQ